MEMLNVNQKINEGMNEFGKHESRNLKLEIKFHFFCLKKSWSKKHPKKLIKTLIFGLFRFRYKHSNDFVLTFSKFIFFQREENSLM